MQRCNATCLDQIKISNDFVLEKTDALLLLKLSRNKVSPESIKEKYSYTCLKAVTLLQKIFVEVNIISSISS